MDLRLRPAFFGSETGTTEARVRREPPGVLVRPQTSCARRETAQKFSRLSRLGQLEALERSRDGFRGPNRLPTPRNLVDTWTTHGARKNAMCHVETQFCAETTSQRLPGRRDTSVRVTWKTEESTRAISNLRRVTRAPRPGLLLTMYLGTTSHKRIACLAQRPLLEFPSLASRSRLPRLASPRVASRRDCVSPRQPRSKLRAYRGLRCCARLPTALSANPQHSQPTLHLRRPP